MLVAFAHNKNIKENVKSYNTASERNVKTRLKVNIQKVLLRSFMYLSPVIKYLFLKSKYHLFVLISRATVSKVV